MSENSKEGSKGGRDVVTPFIDKRKKFHSEIEQGDAIPTPTEPSVEKPKKTPEGEAFVQRFLSSDGLTVDGSPISYLFIPPSK